VELPQKSNLEIFVVVRFSTFSTVHIENWVISASLRTALRLAQAANSQPKPKDACVDVRDFGFGDGEDLAALKRII
jgi:hypothetical protein